MGRRWANVKNNNSEEGIRNGDKFLCFKTVSFDERPDNIIFKVGKIYESKNTDCITDEYGNKFHFFTYSFWTQHLVKLNENGTADLSTAKDVPLADKIMLAKLIKQYRNG